MSDRRTYGRSGAGHMRDVACSVTLGSIYLGGARCNPSFSSFHLTPNFKGA